MVPACVTWRRKFLVSEERAQELHLHSQCTTHQPHLVMALRGWTWANCYSEISPTHCNKASFVARQNTKMSNSPSCNSRRYQLRKLFSFTMCVADFANHRFILSMQMQQFCWHSCGWCRHAHLQSMSKRRFSWRCPHSGNNFVYLAPVFYVFSVCLEWKLLLQAFSRNCNLFPCLEQTHPETFVWICDDTSGSAER